MLSNKHCLPGGKAAVQVAGRQVAVDPFRQQSGLTCHFAAQCTAPECFAAWNVVTIIWYSLQCAEAVCCCTGLCFFKKGVCPRLILVVNFKKLSNGERLLVSVLLKQICPAFCVVS